LVIRVSNVQINKIDCILGFSSSCRWYVTQFPERKGSSLWLCWPPFYYEKIVDKSTNVLSCHFIVSCYFIPKGCRPLLKKVFCFVFVLLFLARNSSLMYVYANLLKGTCFHNIRYLISRSSKQMVFHHAAEVINATNLLVLIFFYGRITRRHETVTQIKYSHHHVIEPIWWYL
jgi:hypothetical protein